MASIVLGLGTSHGPMLTLPPERWSDRVDFDRSLPSLIFEGEQYQFDGLAERRRGERLDRQITAAVMRDRFAACRRAINRVAAAFEDARIDQAIIIGNDQMEVFTNENLPAFLICQAANIENIPFSPEQKERLGPGILEAEPGHHGSNTESYPGIPAMARHLITGLIEQDFDVAVSDNLPNPPESRSSGAPHAFGFVYRQIFRGKPVANLPIFLNTFYPPNQPTARRCAAFGRALARSLMRWDEPGRIAVIGSGGLSHFVVDEKLDRDFLAAIERRDFHAIETIPEASLRAGTSELKNWIVTAALLDELGLSLTSYDYIPCYRSIAGTGNAMAFAEWH